MKKCPKCNKKYTNDKEFCVECGSKLVKPATKYILIIIVIIISCMLGNYFIFGDSNKYEDSKQSSFSYSSLDDYSLSPTTSDLSIGSWYAYRRSGYTYIEGSVKNVGSQTIGYYKITAKYYDSYSKKVIDSDYTNSAEDLEPGESRKFEIMTKGIYGEDDIELFVDEVD